MLPRLQSDWSVWEPERRGWRRGKGRHGLHEGTGGGELRQWACLQPQAGGGREAVSPSAAEMSGLSHPHRLERKE